MEWVAFAVHKGMIIDKVVGQVILNLLQMGYTLIIACAMHFIIVKLKFTFPQHLSDFRIVAK